jgi:hypothetical protein
LNGDNAPGLDFSLAFFFPFFFQKCREVLKEDIMAAFKEFHGRGHFEKSINATFISQIPKKAGAMNIKYL